MLVVYGIIVVYLLKGGSYDNFYIGGFKGFINVNLYGIGNSVYLFIGILGVRYIENEGIINLDGVLNIVYLNIGYIFDWSKIWY